MRPLSRLAPRALFELAFALVTLATVLPLFSARHLPLQDLPQHMAAMRVLRALPFDHGLSTYFVQTLSRTQYLLVYALGVVFSLPLGIIDAARLVAVITVASLPYAVRFVLRRTGGDERLAALCWPIAWNPQMMLGFLNFLLGVPVALFAIGLFADRRARRTPRRQVVLALLSLAAFYSHLVPYGLLGLGALLLLDTPNSAALPADASVSERARALGSDAKNAARELLFLAPSLFAVLVWVLRTPAADASVRAGGVGVVPHPEWPPMVTLPRELSTTLLDFPGELDERALILWGLGLGAAIALKSSADAPTTGAVDATQDARKSGVMVALPFVAAIAYLCRHRLFQWVFGALAEEPATWGAILGRSAPVFGMAAFVSLSLFNPSLASAPHEDHASLRRLAWLPVLCGLLYVVTPGSYGWIWPIHTRFAVTAALIAPLMASGRPRGRAAWLIAAALTVATAGLSQEVGARFAAWEQYELGDLDEALAEAQPGRRLVAVVPAAASGHVPNVPLLHAAAWYQVRGGAVATFSFADFPQSPFRYREDGPRPPRLRPRWEWESSLSTADPDMNYYDYVLVRRGAFDEPAQHPERYARRYEGRQWLLYERNATERAP